LETKKIEPRRTGIGGKFNVVLRPGGKSMIPQNNVNKGKWREDREKKELLMSERRHFS